MTRTVRRKLMVIGATLFLLFGAAMVKAQNFPVRASVTIVNPSPYLEDYGRDGNTIIILTLVDNRPSYQGLLRLSIIGQGFEATTNEATFLGRPITLTRGVPIILRGPELAPYFDLNNLNIEGLAIDNTIGNGGRIPDGPITITAEFFDINRFDAPAVSNLGLATRFVQQNYPPELVAPLGEIPGQPVPVINFSWTPRHIPQPANDEYVLQVWEKVPGLTDDQIANSRGFQRRPIITRIPRYTYTNADSRMEIGKSYLWRVQVRDQRNVRQFVNNGYSTYGTFIYGIEDDPGGDDCLGPTGLAVTNIGETSADLNWSFPSGEAQDNLTISTRITGQSTWQEVGTVPGNVTSYNLQGLTLATGYEVKVCTTCKSGEEDPCTALAFVTPTPDCGPLPQPITYAVTNSNILVTWENILQAEGYLLNWRKIPNPGDPVEAMEAPIGVAVGGDNPSTAPSNNPGTSAPPPNTLILPAGSTEGTATGLAAGWNYAFKLCKDCPDGTQECVEWVEVFNGAIDYCSDDYAPYLTVVYGSETQSTLDLGWTLAAAPSLPQGYSQTLTYFPTTVLGTTDTVTLSNNQLGTTIEGLEVETEYTAKICVLCPDGNMLCSTVNGTTLPYACPDEFALESGVVVTPVIPDGIKVDWTLFGASTTAEGWSFALLNMAGDTLQRATAGVGYTHTFMGLTAETEYRIAYCHECEDGTENCAEETVFLTGCDDADLTLETGLIHFDFVELVWQDAGAEKYTVTFSEQGSSTSIGDPQTTENTDFTLGGLSPLTSYEISVCFECGATPVCDTIVVTTIGVNCALAGDYEYDFECGLNVSLQDPENQQLVETLNPGDSIWAGDFLVEIAEITGNTTFGGFGHTKIPYLAGAKLQLDFHEIQVNEDCRMVAGKMVVKSPLEAALEQLQQGLLDLQDLLGDIDLFLGNLSAGLGSVTTMLNELATAADVTDEANAVLDQLVTALGQVPYLPDSYVDAVEDAAECLRQAALTGTDDDVRDCRDQLLEAIQNAQDYIDDLFDADFIVDFSPTVPPNVYWGVDSQRYDLITESYDQRTIGGTPYKVPWASTSTDEPSGVPFGAVRRDGETMNPVNFIGSDTQPYPGWTKDGTSASNPGLYADGDQQVKVVFAAHDNPDAEEGNDSIPPVKLAGQLNVVTYTPVQHTVHIIPVNGVALTQDAGAVELALNRIFRPSVAEWTVSIEPELSVPEFDGQLSDIPESLLSNYTPEMNLLKGKVKDQGYYDGDDYYLIVVPSMQEPGRLGFMPRKRSFGFLSAAQLTDATRFNRTAAHELAHGAFHLQHVYDRFDGLTPGATDNLMDSGNGEALYKYQWDNVHDPESNFTLFDEEEEGESVVLETFMELLLEGGGTLSLSDEDDQTDILAPQTTFFAPSGVGINIPQTIKVYYDGERRNGVVKGFKIGDKKYYRMTWIPGDPADFEDEDYEPTNPSYRRFDGFLEYSVRIQLLRTNAKAVNQAIIDLNGGYFPVNISPVGAAAYTRALQANPGTDTPIVPDCYCEYYYGNPIEATKVSGLVRDYLTVVPYSADDLYPICPDDCDGDLNDLNGVGGHLYYTLLPHLTEPQQAPFFELCQNLTAKIGEDNFGVYVEDEIEVGPTSYFNVELANWIKNKQIFTQAEWDSYFPFDDEKSRDCAVIFSGSDLGSRDDCTGPVCIPANYNELTVDFVQFDSAAYTQPLYEYSFRDITKRSELDGQFWAAVQGFETSRKAEPISGIDHYNQYIHHYGTNSAMFLWLDYFFNVVADTYDPILGATIARKTFSAIFDKAADATQKFSRLTDAVALVKNAIDDAPAVLAAIDNLPVSAIKSALTTLNNTPSMLLTINQGGDVIVRSLRATSSKTSGFVELANTITVNGQKRMRITAKGGESITNGGGLKSTESLPDLPTTNSEGKFVDNVKVHTMEDGRIWISSQDDIIRNGLLDLDLPESTLAKIKTSIPSGEYQIAVDFINSLPAAKRIKYSESIANKSSTYTLNDMILHANHETTTTAETIFEANSAVNGIFQSLITQGKITYAEASSLFRYTYYSPLPNSPPGGSGLVNPVFLHEPDARLIKEAMIKFRAAGNAVPEGSLVTRGGCYTPERLADFDVPSGTTIELPVVLSSSTDNTGAVAKKFADHTYQAGVNEKTIITITNKAGVNVDNIAYWGSNFNASNNPGIPAAPTLPHPQFEVLHTQNTPFRVDNFARVSNDPLFPGETIVRIELTEL